MEKFFRIHLLPAKQGDAIWVEYGNNQRPRRILIDAGPADAYPQIESTLKTLPEGDKRVELVVITHVDTDHIEGIIKMFAEKRSHWLFSPEDIWFNGYRHMKNNHHILGGKEGDYLSALLHHRAYDSWNKKFDSETIFIEPEGPLPSRNLEDGMNITLLSPDKEKLDKMAAEWQKDVSEFGLIPGDLDKAWELLSKSKKLIPKEGILGEESSKIKGLKKQLKPDQSIANGSSIAFLAQFEGKSCLFLGDAHQDIIISSVKRLIPHGEQKLKVDAVKVSHHGSKNNVSKELLDLIDTRHFLVSTDGIKFPHPDYSAIDTIIKCSDHPNVWFNYCSEYTQFWEKNENVIAHFPPKNKEGISIDLMNSK